MNAFLAALQFLTVLPVKINKPDSRQIAYSAAFFPLAGFFIGLFLSGAGIFFSGLGMPALAVSIIIVVSLVAITGGLHLDGLADTADAFLSGKNKEEMLLIMRDPHIGTMGVLSVVSVLLLKVGLLLSLTGFFKVEALILAMVLSRWSATLGMRVFPYARKEGKAALFIQGMDHKIFLLSTFSAFICAFLFGFSGIFSLFACGIGVFLIGNIAKRKISGITGDILGATIELTEVIVLATVFLTKELNIWIR